MDGRRYRLTLARMHRRRLSLRQPKAASAAHRRPRSRCNQRVCHHTHGPSPPCVPLSHSVRCVASPIAAAVFNDTLPSLEAAWTPPVFGPTKEETEARKRLAERCKACGLDVLLPFAPLVERLLLRDRQPLQPLRGVGGRMVLASRLASSRPRVARARMGAEHVERRQRASASRARCERTVRGADGGLGALALTGRLTVMRLSCKVTS